MSPVAALLLGIVAGLLVASALWVRERRRQAAMLREVLARVGPVLERRATALGLASPSSPEVNVGRDGELVLEHADGLARLLRLADAIEAHERAQLGYLDTIRVAKDDMAAQLGPR